MEQDYTKIYSVEREGKSLKLKAKQLTTQVLAKLFSVFPETILLVSEDGYVETADEDGNFDDIDDLPTWTVAGDSTKPSMTMNAHLGANGMTPYSYQQPQLWGPSVNRGHGVGTKAGRGRGKGKGKWTPSLMTSTMFGQVPPGVRTQQEQHFMQQLGLDDGGSSSSHVGNTPAPVWRKNIEICKWSERDKQWKKISNLPIEVSEEVANIKGVSGIVAKDAFGGEPAILLDNDFLRIPDTPNTTGKFWKSTKRIRAVKKTEYQRKRPMTFSSEDDDSDFECPPPKRTKKSQLEERLQKIEAQLNENVQCETAVTEAKEREKSTQLQYNELRQCFVCLVCKDTVDFPALVSPCCKIILGCEECIQQWLESSPQCPHCRKTLLLEDCMSLPIIRSLKSVLTAGESSSHSSSPLIEID